MFSIAGAPDSQNLGVVVYEVHPLFVRTVVPPQPLPLPPKSTLKWAGFSDEGRLCSFDSTGVLRCLGSDMMHWAVLTDTRLVVIPFQNEISYSPTQ